MLTLYTTPLSANGRKVLAASHHLGLRPQVKLVDVYRGEGRSPEYLAVHPLGKIPAMVDGDLTLWESNAILQYLAEAYGGGRLWSSDPRRRADVARWMFWESAHWQPTIAAVPGLAPLVASRLGIRGAPESPAPVSWMDPSFVAVARFLDQHLRGRRAIAGAELSIADFSVAGMLTYARAADFPFAAYPSIAAWYEGVEALEAWRATAAGPWR